MRCGVYNFFYNSTYNNDFNKGDDLYPEEEGAIIEEVAKVDELPASNVQNRILHKSPYHNEINVLNFQPKCNHIVPIPLNIQKL